MDRCDYKAVPVFDHYFAHIDLVAPVEADPPLILSGRNHLIYFCPDIVHLDLQTVFGNVHIACDRICVVRDQDDLHRFDDDQIVGEGKFIVIPAPFEERIRRFKSMRAGIRISRAGQPYLPAAGK